MSDAVTPPTLVIYRGNSLDGFGAAWAVHKKFGEDVEYYPADEGAAAPDVSGHRVLIIGVSYPTDVLTTLASHAASITLLSHNPPEEATITTLLATDKISATCDATCSDAVMAWRHFHDSPIPPLLAHVQDLEMMLFQIPATSEICATILSFPYSFPVWNWLDGRAASSEGHDGLANDGAAIRRWIAKDLIQISEATKRPMTIGGISVQVANVLPSCAAEVASLLAPRDAPGFGASFYLDRTDGRRVFTLRSVDGVTDVGAIAAEYGGHGSASLATFVAAPGWEGDA